MTVATSLLALARPSGDLVAGIVIGVALGFLLGPFVRYVLAMREWAAASREARLTNELIARLPDPTDVLDADRDDAGPGEPAHVDDDRVPVRWRTSR
jgi:hypothetical protein